MPLTGGVLKQLKTAADAVAGVRDVAANRHTTPIHFDAEYAATTEWERPLVDSTFTLALVTGLSVVDVSERGVNLGWREVRLPAPVFAGDTLRAETEILEKRESKSRPGRGIVTVRTRGLNQRDEVVIEFERSIMVPLA